MRNLINDYLPFLLSILTIWMTISAGNKSRHAWVIGLVNQILWLVWVTSSATWGLLPLTVTLTVIYARNYLKWAGK